MNSINKGYLHNLTALRGIAALLVVLLHFHFFLGAILPKNTTGIIDKLYLMVDLFFILSGFVICYVYGDTFINKLKAKDYKQFLIARVARIYPLHLITLLAELFIFGFILTIDKFQLLPKWHQHLYRLDAIPVQLLFLQTVGIFNFDTWNAPAWSLSAEWWAYVIFPLLIIPIGRLKLKWLFVFIPVVIAAWFAVEFVLAPLQPFMNRPPNPKSISLDVNWHYGTLRGIVGFLAGMIVWKSYVAIQDKKIKIYYNDWVMATFVCLSLCSMHFKWYDTITVTFFSVIILCAALGGKKMNAFFSFKVFQNLGKWSFSMYMWHMVLINLVIVYHLFFREEPIKGLLRPFNHVGMYKYVFLVLFVVLVCFVGALSYRFVETPTRKWINKKV